MNSTKQVIAVAVGLAFSGVIVAQGTAGSGAGTAPDAVPPRVGAPATTSPAVTSRAASPAAASAATVATHQLKTVRLGKLDDVNVYDNNDKKIGEVEDVVLDASSGRVQYVVVSIGGLMGVGDKEYAVQTKDLGLFSRSADDSVPSRATLSVPRESLTPAKKLDKDSPYVMASKLIGTDVEDSNGKEAGEIEDLVLDMQSGQVQYALMEFDKAWSLKDKLFAFKMSDFQKHKDGKKLVLNVTKESLNQTPSLDKSRLDDVDLSDPAWTSKLSRSN